jgi:Fur family ferric uptake transcriptional regulator
MTTVAQRAAAFEAELKDAGLRMTQQRRLILRVLAEATDHPDAKAIFHRIFAHDPSLSLSTVYRTMKLLEERGAIERHAFDDGVSRYEHADQQHHDHLIDVETGQVIEFSSEEIEKLQARIAAELGYDIVRHRLELYGRKRR